MKEEEKFVWDWLKHENNILTNRGSFFLIAESVFFAIVATNTSTTSIVPAGLLYTTGLLITYIWLLVNIKHIYVTHPLITKKLNTFEDHPWIKIKEYRKKVWPLSNHKLLGIFLPSLFLLLWIILLASYLRRVMNITS